MTADKIVDTVTDAISEARSKVEMVGAHSRDVLKAGTQTLHSAREVVAQAGRDAAELLSHTRDELKRTLKEGAVQIGERLSRLATPTRKEEAMARKLEVKAKKLRKRADRIESESVEPAGI